MKPTRWLLLSLLLARPLLAGESTVQLVAYGDINGDGRLSCEEPLLLSLKHPFHAGDSGTLTVPLRAEGLQYTAGGAYSYESSVFSSCEATLLQGNSNSDSFARWRFSCAHDGFLFLRFTAGYHNASTPTFQFGYDVELGAPSGLTFHSSGLFRDPAEVCPGTTTPTASDVTLVKRATTPAIPGQVLSYSITASSSTGRGGVQMVETVPEGSVFEAGASTPGWTCLPGPAAGSTCRLPLGNLPPGVPVPAVFSVRLDSPYPVGLHTVTNTVCALEGPSLQIGCSTVTDPVDAAPRLSLQKTLASGSAVPGALLVWSLAVQNAGNQGSEAVVLSETVPPLTTFSAADSSPGWSCAGATPGSLCTLLIPGVAPGETRSYAFAARANAAFPAGTTTIGNTSCLAADACSTSTLPTGGVPALEIAKLPLNLPEGAGSLVTYRLVVRNVGNQGASGVVVREGLPAETRFASRLSSPGWSCDGSACSFPLGKLAAGASAEIDFAVELPSPLPAGFVSLANQACAEAAGLSPVCAQVSLPAGGHPRLEVTKLPVTAAAPQAGTVFRWGLHVENTGDQILDGIVLSETLPPGATFSLLGSSPGWTCVDSACTFPVGTLAPGFFVDAQFSIVPASDAPLANTACASSPLASHCGSASSPSPAALAATLTDDLGEDRDHSGNLSAGDSIAYTLVITNTSQSLAVGAIFDIPLEVPHLTLVDSSLTSDCPPIERQDAHRHSMLTVSLGDIPAGGRCTITFRMDLDSVLPADVDRVAQQVSVAAVNVRPFLSDDPETAVPLDPTVSLLGRRLGIVEVPTLGQIGLAGLASLLGACGLAFLRRRSLPRSLPA